jgi:hypothetical protein
MTRKKTPTKEIPMSKNITVQGIDLPVVDQFAEGHILTAVEAAVLSQTYNENLRNNFATRVKEAKEVLGEDFNTETPYTVGEKSFASISEQWAAHVEAYAFGTRRVGGGGKRTTDPVQREALRIAKASVESAIRTKYGKLDAVSKDKITELVESLAAREDIQDKAKANIANMGSVDLGIEV